MKKFICGLLVVCMLFTMTACTGGKTAPEDEAKDTVTEKEPEKVVAKGDYVVGGGSTGGTYNAVSSVLAQFFKKADLGNFTAQATTGSGQNIVFLENGSAEFAMVIASVAIDAYKGEGAFEDAQFEDLRSMFHIYPSYFQLFVSTSSGIEKEEDVFGKKICIGAPGSGDVALAGEVFGAWGMGLDDYKPEYVGAGEGAEQLKDGHIDGAIGVTPIPYGTFLELTSVDKAKVMPLSDSTIEKLTSGEGAKYYPLTIPAGTYKHQDEDVNTVGLGSVFCTNANVDEEIVYEMVKEVWEEIDELKSLHAALGDMELEDAMLTSGVPLHPGAERYYREIGLLK